MKGIRLGLVGIVLFALAGCSSVPLGGSDLLPQAEPVGVEFSPKPDAPTAPQFSSSFLDGSPVQSAELWEDRVVILHFMTGWCTQCVRVLEPLKEASKKYGDAVSVVLVSGDQDNEVLDTFLSDNDVKFPVVVDQDLRVWHKYAVKEPPATVLIDSEGGMVRMWPAEFTGDQLEEALESVITLTQ